MIRRLASSSRFKLIDYKSKTYQEALEEFDASKEALLSDSVEQASNDEELSKYDKIRNSREAVVARSEDDEFDESQFIYYALSDLINDESFKKAYREHKESIRLEEEQEMLSGEKSNDIVEVGKELLFYQPYVVSYYYDDYETKSSYEKEVELRDYIFEIAANEEYDLIDLSKMEASMRTTQGYNERMLLSNNLRQSYIKGDIELLPVDYSEYGDFKQNYGDKKVLLTYVKYKHTKATFNVNITAYLLAPSTNEVWIIDDYDANVPFKKGVMKSFSRNLFKELENL